LSHRIVAFLLFFSLVAAAVAQNNAMQGTPAPGSSASSSTTQTSAPPENPTPHFYDRMNFTAGAGYGIGRDDVSAFVGNSGFFTVGAGWNWNRRVGFDAEYMFYDLPFKSSVIKSQALPGQSGYMQSISLDAIITTPLHFHGIGTYGILGVGFYDRHVALRHPQFLYNGTPWQPAWRWWDLDYVLGADGQYSIQVPGANGMYMGSNSRVAGGFNYGGGLTHRIPGLGRAKFFAEFRYHRAYQADGKTIEMPISVGLKW
jgi:hypothetical protein